MMKTLLFRVLGAQVVVGQDQAAVDPTQDCQCQDERGGCAVPVCPPGFYKCCFDCEVSTCAREALGYWPNGLLTLSERGVMECIQCKPGDYCPGCDRFEECPRETALAFGGAAGGGGLSPRISASGSILARECQRCPDGFEADIDRARCVPLFRGMCDIKLLELCMLGCKENPTDEVCETFACKLYCANDQAKTNPGCIGAFTDTCTDLNIPFGDQGNLVLTTTPAPSLLLSDDSGIAQVVPLKADKQCDLLCSGANRSLGFGFLAVGSIFFMFFI